MSGNDEVSFGALLSGSGSMFARGGALLAGRGAMDTLPHNFLLGGRGGIINTAMTSGSVALMLSLSVFKNVGNGNGNTRAFSSAAAATGSVSLCLLPS